MWTSRLVILLIFLLKESNVCFGRPRSSSYMINEPLPAILISGHENGSIPQKVCTRNILRKRLEVLFTTVPENPQHPEH